MPTINAGGSSLAAIAVVVETASHQVAPADQLFSALMAATSGEPKWPQTETLAPDGLPGSENQSPRQPIILPSQLQTVGGGATLQLAVAKPDETGQQVTVGANWSAATASQAPAPPSAEIASSAWLVSGSKQASRNPLAGSTNVLLKPNASSTRGGTTKDTALAFDDPANARNYGTGDRNADISSEPTPAPASLQMNADKRAGVVPKLAANAIPVGALAVSGSAADEHIPWRSPLGTALDSSQASASVAVREATDATHHPRGPRPGTNDVSAPTQAASAVATTAPQVPVAPHSSSAWISFSGAAPISEGLPGLKPGRGLSPGSAGSPDVTPTATYLPLLSGIAAEGQSHGGAGPQAPPVLCSDVMTSGAPASGAMARSEMPAPSLAMHVAQALMDGDKTITVELHPAELGRVEIHFSFHSDGMNVRMTLDRPETFEAFSHDRGGLEQQLAQAGVDLGGGGLDLRLGQPTPDQTESYSSGRNPGVASSTSQTAAAPKTLWIGNNLLDILA